MSTHLPTQDDAVMSHAMKLKFAGSQAGFVYNKVAAQLTRCVMRAVFGSKISKMQCETEQRRSCHMPDTRVQSLQQLSAILN